MAFGHLVETNAGLVYGYTYTLHCEQMSRHFKYRNHYPPQALDDAISLERHAPPDRKGRDGLPDGITTERRWESFQNAEFDHRSRPFRIELRNEVSRILDRVEGVFPQFRTLDPYASRLLQDGEEGELVLIDETTDQVVARKMVN